MENHERDRLLDKLQGDLAGLTLMTEFLYVMYFKHLEDGKQQFAKFASVIKKSTPILSAPRLDAITADDAAQSLAEAILPMLERIELRLSNPEGKAL